MQHSLYARNLKKHIQLSLILGIWSFGASASFAATALAPVESRHAGGTSGSTVSQTVESPRVFSGINKNSGPATLPAPKTIAASSNNSTAPSYPMNAQDRAAHLTLSQIENLQREVGELRGLVETQEHTIKQLKKSQQDLYLDLERRLNQLQTTAQARTTSSSTTTSPATGLNKPVKANTHTAGQIPVKPAAKNTNSPEAQGVSMAKTVAPTATVSVAKTTSASKEKNTESQPVSQLLGEQETYQNAYAFVRSKKYTEAIAGLQDYLSRFQKGEQAPQAHYWLGEVYMVQWQNDKNNLTLLEKAKTEFTSITAEYPNHPKTADALLKLGLIEIDGGNEITAAEYLTEVKTRYPGSAAARIAENRLQQLSVE